MGNVSNLLHQIPTFEAEHIDTLVAETAVPTTILNCFGIALFRTLTNDDLSDKYRDRFLYLYYEELWMQHLNDYEADKIFLNSWYWYRVVTKHEEDKKGALDDWRDVETKLFFERLSLKDEDIPIFQDMLSRTKSLYEE